MTWLGLDIGTSSTKGAVVDRDGAVVRQHAIIHHARTEGPPGEQDPLSYLDSAFEVMATLADSDIEGIGLSGQTPTLVVLDADGTPIRPALTWQDTRAARDAEELARVLGDSLPLVGTLLPWVASNLPAKLRWLKRNEPATFDRARMILQPKDYVGWALTGSAASDPWSMKGMSRVDSRHAVAADILDEIDIPRSLVPETKSFWDRRGTIKREIAERHGLRPGLPVSIGAADSVAAMLAMGIFDRPTSFVVSGTSLVVGQSGNDSPGMTSDRLFVMPRECAPRSVAFGPTQTGGSSVAWLASILGCTVDEALSSPIGGVSRVVPVFVPWLNGERAPIWRNDVRGAFVGLSLEVGTPEIVSAVMSGVVSSARHILEVALQTVGAEPERLVIAGPWAEDDRWHSVLQDGLRKPHWKFRGADASVYGAALLGAIASGLDIEDAATLGEARVAPSRFEGVLGPDPFPRYLAATRLLEAWHE